MFENSIHISCISSFEFANLLYYMRQKPKLSIIDVSKSAILCLTPCLLFSLARM